MSIRSRKWKTARRNRECYRCGDTIKKGEKYLNIEKRYDGKIITFSYCCIPKEVSINPKIKD